MDRILLLAPATKKRAALAASLSAAHDVVQADSPSALEEPFDLCILDASMVGDASARIEECRRESEPVFLPFLMLSPRTTAESGAEMDAVLPRSADPDQIVTRVNELLSRRRWEQTLAGQNEMFSTIIENTPEASLLYLDHDFDFLWVNSTYAASCDMCKEDFAGKNHFELFPDPEVEQIFRKARDTGERVEFKARPFTFENQPWRGVTYWDWTLTPINGGDGKTTGLVFSLVDVTERARREQLSREFERLDSLVHSTLDFAEIMDHVAAQMTAATGCEFAGILLKVDDVWRGDYVDPYLHATPEERTFSPEQVPVAEMVLKSRHTVILEDASKERHARDALERFGVKSIMNVPLFAGGDVVGVLGLGSCSAPVRFLQPVIDFAERLAASASLALTNARLYEAEQREAATLQRSQDELRCSYDEAERRVEERTRDLRNTNEALQVEVANRRKTEAKLEEAIRAYRTISASNEVLVRATDEHDLLQSVCATLVDTGGYRMAWVGLLEYDESKTVTPVASAGIESGYLETLNVSWGDQPTAQGPTGRSVREGRPVTSHDIEKDIAYGPWRDEAVRRGYRSSISLPLFDADRSVLATLGIYSAQRDAFDEAETSLLSELAADLSFGIQSLRTDLRREEAEERLRRSYSRLERLMRDVVGAMSKVVYIRDPYTSGHQERVSALAKAIAEKVGLPDEGIACVEMAGLVHDVGKLHIPAEILTCPLALSDIEFALIKTHSRQGYDTLKDISFPWPIADTVLQHHERMDGSGYPYGLKGDEILGSSRILAVADVVEAMSSHRPYRAALGIEAAAQALRDQCPVCFDPSAVEACIDLWQEGRLPF